MGYLFRIFARSMPGSLATLALACGCSVEPAPSAAADAAASGSDAAGSVTAAAGSDATASPDGAAGPDATSSLPTPAEAGPCGALESGTPLHVAQDLDLCMPKVACTAETCPPMLGDCVNDRCVFKSGYDGVATLPEAWVTYYCDLPTGGCHGITQIAYPEVTAAKIAAAVGLSLCAQSDAGDAGGSGASECVGIAAAPATIIGNSQEAVDSLTGKLVTDWGLGLTEASGLCYELTGPAGTVLVALTDRCGGYCRCNGSAFQECGPCVNAADMQPQCPCVGTAPPAYSACCGAGSGCGALESTCDWCASNNHPHFDLDMASFDHVCGAGAFRGSCQLLRVRYLPCLEVSGWPPG